MQLSDDAFVRHDPHWDVVVVSENVRVYRSKEDGSYDIHLGGKYAPNIGESTSPKYQRLEFIMAQALVYDLIEKYQ
jgi:hypothetical protein